MENIMLRVRGISKQYRLGQIGGTTLRDSLKRAKAKALHKEDPTLKIGAKVYKNGELFMAVKEASFDVVEGERVGIIGHNGAGKTTLLKMISRITAPTEGSFSLNGRVASMLEVGTGFNLELTGRENIYMNGAILGMTKKEIDAKVEEIIDFSECRDFIDTPIKRYSRGMCVKLAFAVAAHLEAEILIMDEILAVGDMAFQKKCLAKMREISENKNRTILYVSHNMDTIRELCDRVIVMERGQLVYDGDVDGGIALYLKNNKEKGIEFILDDRHGEKSKNGSVQMNRIQLLNSSNGTYECGSDLSLYLDIEAKEDVQSLRFLIEIFGQDNGIIGSMLTPEGFTADAGRKYRLAVSADTKSLAPGTYWTRMIAFSGPTGKVHDSVSPAFSFEIADDYYSTMRWNASKWGRVVFGCKEASVISEQTSL